MRVHAYVLLYVPYVCRCLWSPEDSIRIPGSRVPYRSEVPSRCWDPNPNPLSSKAADALNHGATSLASMLGTFTRFILSHWR